MSDSPPAAAAAAAGTAPPPPPPPPSVVLASGVISGLAARLVTFPADTLKARMQVRGAVAAPAAAGAAAAGAADAYARGTLAAARHMLRREGAASLYRGFGAVAVGLVPANVAYFGAYEAARNSALLPAAWRGSPLGDMAVGAAAQVAAGVVYTPVDVVKERRQVAALLAEAQAMAQAPAAAGGGANAAASSSSSSAASAAAETARAARALPASFGGLLARGQLLRGFWATNAVWLPWNALYVAGYEALRREAADALQLDGGPAALPGAAVAACSAAAAAAAGVATHPLDVVKTRLQVLGGGGGGGARPPSALALARAQLRAEGVRSFWAGLGPRLLNLAPGCAISWALYERLKPALGELLAPPPPPPPVD